MSILWLDGAELLNTAQLRASRLYTVTGTGWSVGGTAGRYGGPGYLIAASSTARCQVEAGGAQGTACLGFWYQPQTSFTNNGRICYFQDGLNVPQMHIAVDGGGTPAIKGDASHTVLAAASQPLTIGTWVYLEFRVVFAASGTAELRIDGTTWAAWSGDTAPATVHDYATGFGLGGNSSIAATKGAYDDLVYSAGDFLGAGRIVTLSPAGTGATTQLAPTGGTVGWECVDELGGADDATTYVSAPAGGSADTYALGTLDSGYGVPQAVSVRYQGSLSDTGGGSVAPLLRSGGTDYAGGTAAAGTAWACGQALWPTDPNGDAAWTVARVNGLEAGVQVV